jgi:hypothetical protein
MKLFNCAVAVAVVAVGFMATAPKSEAQVGINIGAAPVCPYGYYDYAPYACAPYGYYGSEWFSGGIFIGAGPWFHGPAGFHGHVDNRFDIHRGYGGPLPNRGDRPDPGRGFDHIDHFRGNEMRDGRGHVGGGRR